MKLKEKRKENMKGKRLKIGVIDIESNGLNGFKADLAYVLCMGYSELTSSKIYCVGLNDFSLYKKQPYNDEMLIRKIHEILQSFDILVGHYIKKFDWPFLKTRFKKYNLPKISVEIIDTWEIYRYNMKLSSNRLANIANFFEFKQGKMSKGSDWSLHWKQAAAGELKAINFIRKYCKQDIRTSKEMAMHCREYWPLQPISRAISKNSKPFPKYLGKPKIEIDENTLELLKEKILIKGRFDCWAWTGYINTKGYGLFGKHNKWYKGKKLVQSHRLMYELFVKKIPENYQIDHLCFNTSCVNPNHLEAVTNAENAKRATLAGRRAQKLTAKQVKVIRKLYKTGKYTTTQLGKTYKVSRHCIGDICNRNRSWRHIT